MVAFGRVAGVVAGGSIIIAFGCAVIGMSGVGAAINFVYGVVVAGFV
jgi:hypothetical protein